MSKTIRNKQVSIRRLEIGINEFKLILQPCRCRPQLNPTLSTAPN